MRATVEHTVNTGRHQPGKELKRAFWKKQQEGSQEWKQSRLYLQQEGVVVLSNSMVDVVSLDPRSGMVSKDTECCSHRFHFYSPKGGLEPCNTRLCRGQSQEEACCSNVDKHHC